MKTHSRFIILCSALAALFVSTVTAQTDTVNFICKELLGRPTDQSVTVNMCCDTDIEVFIEYGLQKSSYTSATTKQFYKANTPFNIVIAGLAPNLTYYYRVKYRTSGQQDFIARNEHIFKTAKSNGNNFTFAVEADPHLDENTNPDLLRITFANIAKSTPDFMLDLGDTFMSEKLKVATQDSITYRHLLLRSYFDAVCHSIPLYLVIGNHEGELGWLLNGTENSLPVLTANTRIKYYPNPLPDNFYSGNTKSEQFVGLRQNYYSWEWGNALFVVLDPYWYTKSKPNKNTDNWSWTLGADQYQWFKNVLQQSGAKFKFVFAHQVIGGINTEGRGGAQAVPYYEMGGKNQDGSWGFSDKRPGWDLPIHQLMVQNKVNIFFHGHDHLYDMEELDGIIYQEVPQPGSPNYKTPGSAADYGYTSGIIIPSSGFLKVTVSDTTAVVDYIRSYLPSAESQTRINGAVEYSYTIASDRVTSVRINSDIPQNFSLEQNYPNPFNPSTTIKFNIPGVETLHATSLQTRLKIYDILGREVATLIDKEMQPGNYTVKFDAGSLPTGIYLYRLLYGNYSRTMKMILLK